MELEDFRECLSDFAAKINLPHVIANQKTISTQISSLPSQMGPPGQQNADLARIIYELDAHSKVMASAVAALDERCRIASNLSASAQPVLDQMNALTEKIDLIADKQQTMETKIDNQCCTIS